MVEVLVATVPATPAVVQLLLQLLPRFPHDRALFWLLPLLLPALYDSQQAAPVADWAAVVQLALQVSASAAAAVARRAAEVHPWSQQLWQLHAETTQGDADARGSTSLWCYHMPPMGLYVPMGYVGVTQGHLCQSASITKFVSKPYGTFGLWPSNHSHASLLCLPGCLNLAVNACWVVCLGVGTCSCWREGRSAAAGAEARAAPTS